MVTFILIIFSIIYDNTSFLIYGDYHLAVITTLLTFVTTFRKAHEENLKQAELEKKKAEKEAAAEKSKSAQLTSKNVLIFISYLSSTNSSCL
jgi:hypothetical protein